MYISTNTRDIIVKRVIIAKGLTVNANNNA